MKKVKLFESFLSEANKGKVHKAAKQGSYPAVIVVVQDGKVIHQEAVSTPQVAPATFNVMQEKYPKALIHLEDKTGKRLFSESVVTEAKYNKKSLLKAMTQNDGDITTTDGKEYIVYKYSHNRRLNDTVWQDDVVMALDQDGEEWEIKYSDIASYNESLVTEKREDVGKYNTVKKVINKLGRRPSEQDLATFINNNYYDVTEVERGDDDPQANDKIADLVGFYKFDIDDWEIAWADAQNESVVTEAKDNLYLQLHKKYAEQIKGLKAGKIKKLTDLVSVQRWSMEEREDYFGMDPKKKKELSAEYNEERKLFKKYVGGDESVMLPKGTEALAESNVNEASEDRMIKQIERALKDGTSIFKLPMATQKYYNKNKSAFESVVTEYRGDGTNKISDDKLMNLIPKMSKGYVGKNTGTGEYTISTPGGEEIVLTQSKDKKNWSYEPSNIALKILNESVVTESVFSFKTDNVEQLHFETDPKTAELMKMELGKSQGAFGKKNQIEDAEYSLRRFRKSINYGNGKDVGVFLPGSYDASVSKLGDGPHKKAVKAVKWNQKKYDQWLEDMAANGGADNAFDMAQNAKNETGLIDWVKKNFRGDDPLQRIQWDIEGYAESVVTEAVELVHVYGEDGKMFGTGELVKTKGKKSLIRWDGSKEEWIDSKLVKLVESFKKFKDHIANINDGAGSTAEVYFNKGKGYYVVVSGEYDYDFDAKDKKELLKKLKDNEFTNEPFEGSI